MKTRKHIMIAVVLIVLFGTVSSSFARPKRPGRGGRAVVRNSYRTRHAHRPGKRAWHRHRRNFHRRPFRRSYFSISLPHLRVVFGGPRTRVVAALPPRIIEPAEITVWITNDNGSLTSVTLTRSFPGYIGPLGEYYSTMPTEQQLKMLYGLRKNQKQASKIPRIYKPVQSIP